MATAKNTNSQASGFRKLDELFFLINKSPAMKKLSREQYDSIIEQVRHRDPAQAENIYKILLAEQENIFKIDYQFQKNTDKTIKNLNNEITEVSGDIRKIKK